MARNGTAPRADEQPKRRRGRALEQAIFEAVFDQINEIGYGRLTMDRLAAAADTSKAVLYRRWDSKESVVLDALRDSLPSMAGVPVHDTLRADLLEVLGLIRAAIVATKGTTFHVVAAEAGGDCRKLATERVFRPAHRAILDALRRAEERGELRPGLATELIADVGPALLRSKAIDGSIPSTAAVTTIVDEILLPLLTSGDAEFPAAQR